MKKKKLKLKKRNLLLLILIVIFLFSTSKIVIFYIDLARNKNLNDKLVEEVYKPVLKEDISEDNQEPESFTIDFDKLLEKNSDTVGWINYNQNKINYPIVQGKDNRYYLKKSFDKKTNSAGAVFLDYRNKSLQDRNTVLFAHSMRDDTMFGSLREVFKDDFLDDESNNYISIVTKDGAYLTYQIFSYYVIEKEEYYIQTTFDSDATFYKFLDTIQRRSWKKFDVTVNTNDKILTLSTCEGAGGTNSRKVIHAKLLQEAIN